MRKEAKRVGTLEELFWSLYFPLRLQGRSGAGTHQHIVTLRHFGRFLGRPANTGDLDNMTVAHFMGWLSEGRSPITTNKSLDKLLAQWRFLNHQGHVKTWPDVRKLPEPERVPMAWMPEEWKRLLASCKQQKGSICGVPASSWWLALHAVIYDTAERISAVMKLEWKDVDLTTTWLHIRPELRKGKTRGKMHRLHPDTIKLLKAIREPTRSPIFPWHRDIGQLWPEYSLILVRAELPHDRNSKFHRARRTVASMYKKAGGDATDLLDHSSRKITQAYLDPRIIGQVQASDLLPRL